MLEQKQVKRLFRWTAGLLAGLLILLNPASCAAKNVQAYTAGQRNSLKPADIAVSRERFLRSAAAHVNRANQVGYGYNRVLNGTSYQPLASSNQGFCCVDLVTHVIYTATASMINGSYHPIGQTLATAHNYSASNGIVFDTQTVSVLGSQLDQMPQLYQSLSAGMDTGSLRLGDVVLTGNQNSSALNHAVLVIGKVTSAENSFMQIPNHNPNTSYFISMSSTSKASYRGISWFNRPWYTDDPSKGYYIKRVYRPLYSIKQGDLGGFRIRKTDASSGAGLTGAEFRLTCPDGTTKTIKMTSSDYTSSKSYAPGPYSLVETKAPAGYLCDSTARPFTIALDEINSNYWNSPIKNTIDTGSVKLVKKDAETGGPIPGAVFDLSQSASFPSGRTVRLTTKSDGTAGPETFYLSNGSSVYAREVSVPAPYLLDSGVKSVKLSRGGTVNLTFQNSRAKGQIEIMKRDAVNGNPVQGAVFQVISSDGKEAGQLTSGADGKARTKSLPLGSYQIREREAAEGYLSDDRTHTAHLVYKDMRTPLVSAGLELENQPVKGRIRIIKRARDDGQPIEGVTFELLDAGGDPAVDLDGEPVPPLVSGEDGCVESPWLRYGGYLVRETDSPLAFYPNGEAYEAWVEEEGATVELEIENERVLILVRIRKYDQEEGGPLAGAVFQVYRESDGSLVADQLVTDEEGEALLPEALPVGDYRLTEIKPPDGYSAGPDQYFTISRETGQETLSRNPGRWLELQAGNRPIQVDLSKKGVSGEEELAGARLQLFELASNEMIKEWVSGQEPHRVSHLTVGASYRIHEVQAPAGYAIGEDLVFRVEDTEEAQFLEILNDLTVTRLEKRDGESGDPLAGVVLELRDPEGEPLRFSWDPEEGAYSWSPLSGQEGSPELLTDEGGEILILGLPQGHYELKEREAARGYALREEAWLLTVAADAGQESPAFLLLENHKTRVKLLKTDGEGRGLEGAGIDIYNEEDGLLLSLVTDEEGELVIRGLPPGSYYYKESKAPKGYERKEETLTFTIDPQGRVSGQLEWVNLPKPVPAMGELVSLLPWAFLVPAAGLAAALKKGRVRRQKP